MTIRERIIFFCNAVGITKAEFERRAGLSNGYINSVKRGVGSKLDPILSAFPDLNKNWLLFEEGDMLKNTSADNRIAVEGVEDQKARIVLEDDGLTVGERLDLFIQSLGLGRYQFEMKCGLSQGYVNNIRNSPHPDKLKRIANVYPELNIEWLMIGRGEMLHSRESGLYKMVEAHHKMVEAKMEIEQNKRNALEERLQEITRLLNKLTKK